MKSSHSFPKEFFLSFFFFFLSTLHSNRVRHKRINIKLFDSLIDRCCVLPNYNCWKFHRPPPSSAFPLIFLLCLPLLLISFRCADTSMCLLLLLFFHCCCCFCLQEKIEIRWVWLWMASLRNKWEGNSFWPAHWSLSLSKKRIIILLYPSEDKQALLNIQTPPSVI